VKFALLTLALLYMRLPAASAERQTNVPDIHAEPAAMTTSVQNATGAAQIQRSLSVGETFLTKIYAGALPVILNSELNRTSAVPVQPANVKEQIDRIFALPGLAGRVARHAGDIASAKASLLAAGKTEGSPVLKSFGPNMSPALGLLAAGDRETVIAYLTECQQFWRNEALDYWIADIQQGKTPDFKLNLKIGLTRRS
jgi:hypothetical protein